MQKFRSILRRALNFTLSLVIVLAAAQAQATITLYDSRDAFHLAMSSNPLAYWPYENWDEFLSGYIIANHSTIRGITYNYVPDVLTPPVTFNSFQVTDAFLASTGSKTLGINGSYAGQAVTFFTSDGIQFVFQDPIRAFAIDISTYATIDGTFTATIGTTGTNGTTVQGVVFSVFDPFVGHTTGQFVGFASDVDFNYVTIAYNLDGAHYGYDPLYGYYVHGWTLDTLIPLPSTLLLLGSGLAGLGLWRSRKRFKA